MEKKTLVIVVHPSLASSTVNKAWAEALRGEVTLHFLYEHYPEGTPIDVRAEQTILEQHDRIIFQFPLYWYAAPSLLKEWMDKIFLDGWAYGAGGDKMEGKEIGVAVSCGGKFEQFVEGGIQRHTIESYMNVFDGICGFVRAKYIGVHAFYDTYNPEAIKTLPLNCEKYLQFIKK